MFPGDFPSRREGSRGSAAADLGEVDARGRADLLGRGDHLLRRAAVALAARQEREAADLHRLADARDVARQRHELLEDEDSVRVHTGALVLLDEAPQRLGLGLAELDDLRRRAAGLLFEAATIGVVRRDDVGLELALDLEGARLLALDLGPHLGDLRLHGAARLLDHRLALGGRVLDALVGLLPRDREIGFDLRHLALRPVVRLLLGGLGLALRLDDARLLPDARAADAADRVQVVLVVGDVLDLERVEHQAHAQHVVLALVEELVRERRLVLVHLLRRELREDAADVALERLARDRGDLLARPAEEALDGVGQARLLARELDLRDALHVERDAALGVGALHGDLDGDVGEIHPVDALEERDAHGAAAADRAVADGAALDGVRPTREDERLARVGDEEEVLERVDDEADHDGGREAQNHDDLADHWGLLSPWPSMPRRSTPSAPPISWSTFWIAAG
jgi:hypothetical protein